MYIRGEEDGLSESIHVYELIKKKGVVLHEKEALL